MTDKILFPCRTDKSLVMLNNLDGKFGGLITKINDWIYLERMSKSQIFLTSTKAPIILFNPNSEFLNHKWQILFYNNCRYPILMKNNIIFKYETKSI